MNMDERRILMTFSFGGGDMSDTWELINEVELDTATRTWTVNTDSNGNSFSLRKIFAIVTVNHDDSNSTGNKPAQWGVNGAFDFKGNVVRYTTWTGRCLFYLADVTTPRRIAQTYYQNDWTNGYNTFNAYVGKVNATNSIEYYFNPSGMNDLMTSFSIQMGSASDTMCSGKMKIYGVKS